jgi:hypothetical protein
MRLIGLLCLFLPAVAIAAEAPRCSDDPAFHQLDFWLGRWSVQIGDKEVGTNHIRTILDGCAVRESWTSSEGVQGDGKSWQAVVDARYVRTPAPADAPR